NRTGDRAWTPETDTSDVIGRSFAYVLRRRECGFGEVGPLHCGLREGGVSLEAETRSGRLRDVLRHRDFRMLLAGYSVSATGDWLYSVALIVYVFQVTGSPTWVAITSFIRF